MNLENFYVSGITFSSDENDLKARYKITNIIIILTILGLIFGITGNLIRDIKGLALIEGYLLVSGFFMIYLLRRSRKYFLPIAEILSFQYSFFFVYLIYVSQIEDMKHIWIFTYPLILLNIQSTKRSFYWFSGTMFMLIISPYQGFVVIDYTPYQILYIVFIVMLISFISYFYHERMINAREIIAIQRLDLEKKYIELSKKDSMLTAQSKLAVMGEMMSMIAHQWRQPLSTVTLNISNIQFKIMLGQKVSDEDLNKALSEISDTVVYLSDTVDDFQTFFHPKKEKDVIEIHDLLQKAVNFAKPRTKEHKIDITINKYVEIEVVTYVNELVQIMLNILNNAIDALESSNKVKPRIIIYVELKGDYIYISIVDNANGISDDIVDNVFEPYFSTKGKNGTGLGLYMSQMLAQKQFDGDISFTSSILGTHFLVKIKKDISS